MTEKRERSAWTRGRLQRHVAEQRAELAHMPERPTPPQVAWLVEHFRYDLDVMEDIAEERATQGRGSLPGLADPVRRAPRRHRSMAVRSAVSPQDRQQHNTAYDMASSFRPLDNRRIL